MEYSCKTIGFGDFYTRLCFKIVFHRVVNGFFGILFTESLIRDIFSAVGKVVSGSFKHVTIATRPQLLKIDRSSQAVPNKPVAAAAFSVYNDLVYGVFQSARKILLEFYTELHDLVNKNSHGLFTAWLRVLHISRQSTSTACGV